MKIEAGINTSIHRAPVVVSEGGPPLPPLPKSLGDVSPIALSLSEVPQLAALFGKNGKIERLRRKLNYLKNKKCKVVPARGTIACVDDRETVYLGVEFLEGYQGHDDILAGIMAHEWGHASALKPSQNELDAMNWTEIFETRKAHEALADYIAGRLLALLGRAPEGLMRFLEEHQTGGETQKYYDAKTRGKIIWAGYQREKELAELSSGLFPRKVYSNHHHGRIIDIV